MRTVLALAITIGLAGPAVAATPGTDLGGLGWMAGSWASDSAGIRMEEHWTAPRGGLMVGMHRDVQGGRATSFEFLRIETDADGLVYQSMPLGHPATPFRLLTAGDRHVTFENAEHDFPQRVLYWLDASGRLHARIEGNLNGKPASENWCWKRAALTDKPAATPSGSSPPAGHSK